MKKKNFWFDGDWFEGYEKLDEGEGEGRRQVRLFVLSFFLKFFFFSIFIINEINKDYKIMLNEKNKVSAFFLKKNKNYYSQLPRGIKIN
jgi:hypothetical protein